MTDRRRELDRLAELSADFLEEPNVFIDAKPYQAGAYRDRTTLKGGDPARGRRFVTPEVEELANSETELREYACFLREAYNLKDIADYDTGPDAAVPLGRAKAAIETAERFVSRIEEIAG